MPTFPPRPVLVLGFGLSRQPERTPRDKNWEDFNNRRGGKFSGCYLINNAKRRRAGGAARYGRGNKLAGTAGEGPCSAGYQRLPMPPSSSTPLQTQIEIQYLVTGASDVFFFFFFNFHPFIPLFSSTYTRAARASAPGKKSAIAIVVSSVHMRTDRRL